MIEIIPNWHPIFVHFTVALFSTSVGFYMLAYLCNKLNFFSNLALEFEIVGRWCLWVVGVLVIGTVLAGLDAYYTVKHDAPSHIVMTDHRNWALVTAGAMMLVALWSLLRKYQARSITITFLVALLVVQGLLLATAWRGAELVFRYGIGVMSLPKAEGEGHQHNEGMIMDKSDNINNTSMEKQPHHHAE